ncbi:MAG: Hsp70 family protein [Planctomycetota bacterium]
MTAPVDDADPLDDAASEATEASVEAASQGDPFDQDDPVVKAMGLPDDSRPTVKLSEVATQIEAPDDEPSDLPIGAEETGLFEAGSLTGGGDEEFDALGFDTSFGAMPGAGGLGEHDFGDADDTPPGGIYVGASEEQVVLDAHTIGRALAEARGEETNFELPDMGVLQRGLIGIDLGAAKAVVARFDADGRHEIVPNQEDDLATPAQVFFDEDGERLVGREARQMAPSAPARAVANLKEMLCDPDFTYTEGGNELDAEEVLAIFLKRLVKDVTERSTQPPTHVALAAPAWFGEEQIDRLKGAVTETGLHLVGITEEALAAAVPYSLRLPDLRPRQALVFDCGHAALGVAIVRCASGDIQVLARSSRRDLGSGAWDRLIADEAARMFKKKFDIDPYKDPAANLDLRLRAEDAKRALTQRPQCTVTVTCGGHTLKVGFTRAGLEKAAKKLIEGGRKLLNEVRQEAGLQDWKGLHALILMGGGSRTPALKKMVTDETGLKAERGISPEEGVAVGALYWGIGERHRLSNH